MMDQLMDDRAGLFRPGWIAKNQCTGWARELQEGRMDGGAMIFCARATRGLGSPSLDTRVAGDQPSPLSTERWKSSGRLMRTVETAPATSRYEGVEFRPRLACLARAACLARLALSHETFCGAELLSHDLKKFDLEY